MVFLTTCPVTRWLVLLPSFPWQGRSMVSNSVVFFDVDKGPCVFSLIVEKIDVEDA